MITWLHISGTAVRQNITEAGVYGRHCSLHGAQEAERVVTEMTRERYSPQEHSPCDPLSPTTVPPPPKSLIMLGIHQWINAFMKAEPS
jgi:hypothetical protein